MNPLQRYAPPVDDEEAFFATCEQPLPSVVHVSTVKTTVARTHEALDDEGVIYEPTDWHPGILELEDNSPGTNWSYFHDWLRDQEEASTLPIIALNPRPGERVWDICAAPGSGTTQTAATMDDKGVLVSNDSNLGRLSALHRSAERLGVTDLVVPNQSAHNFSMKPCGKQTSGRDTSFEQFNRTLADTPRSCEGTCRKNPDVLDEWTMNHVKNVAGIRKGILRRAMQVTKASSTVIYSTCTFASDENEATLDFVLECKDYEVVEWDVSGGFKTAPGITGQKGDEYDPSMTKARHVYPHHDDTGDFFTIKLEMTA